MGVDGLWNDGCRWVKSLEYGTLGIDGLSVLNIELWV